MATLQRLEGCNVGAGNHKLFAIFAVDFVKKVVPISCILFNMPSWSFFAICAPFVPRKLILPMRKPMEQQLELHLCEHVTSAWPLRPTLILAACTWRFFVQSKATTPGKCTDKWPTGSVYKSETCSSANGEIAMKLPWISLNIYKDIYRYRITILFVGCKQGGRTQNVSYSFGHLGEKPKGGGYFHVRPPPRPKNIQKLPKTR